MTFPNNQNVTFVHHEFNMNKLEKPFTLPYHAPRGIIAIQGPYPDKVIRSRHISSK